MTCMTPTLELADFGILWFDLADVISLVATISGGPKSPPPTYSDHVPAPSAVQVMDSVLGAAVNPS